MRVAFSQTYDKMTVDLNRKKEDIDRYTIMIATGERMQRSADDPLGWARAQDFRQGIRELEALAKNVNFAETWNQSTETALTDVMSIISKAIGVGNSSFSSQTPEQRQIYTQELNYYIQEAVLSANSQLGEQYLFGGTSYGTEPFAMTTVGGDVTAVTYQGGPAYDLNVRTSKGSAETVNINGQVAFDTAGTDVLQQLLTLKNAVQAGDDATVRTQLTALQDSFQNLMQLTALTETRQAGLERKSEMLTSLKLSQQDQLENVAGADMATAIIQLQQTQTVYEAALRATSTLSSLNLTNFL